MLKRIYINNFKCFTNFELHPEKMNLLLGPNGSGKTTVFQILDIIQRLIINGEKITDLFKNESLTRWQTDSPVQHIELDISGNQGTYRYHLEVEHQPDQYQARVRHESLFFNTQPLYTFAIKPDKTGASVGAGHLFSDNPEHKGTSLPFDWTRSGLYMIQERHDNKKLAWFKKYLERLFIVSIDPRAMRSETRQAKMRPQQNLSDYADWLDFLADEYRREVVQLEDELKQVIKGFDIFKFSKAGEAKILKAEFTDNTTFRIDELSDGQKVLIALYTLLHCLSENGITLCIDEPESFLALPEIQPWLDSLYDRIEDMPLQAILISHHPRIINYLADSSGFWFSRSENKHVRIQKITDSEKTGISVAKLIELGWIYDE